MINILEAGETIDISEALHAIKAMCQSYAVCKGCPLISFCAVNYRLDPCVWDDADIPESVTVYKKGLKKGKENDYE